ncbi:U3 small nucleolar RNA-associated 12 [Lecanosticta acicola]|uniref:U3 small nucleolar RNA-associated 12 n=1 Tax=Lecanosticta acicola TaxID=111012 RepID=A0AAI8Z1V1_9PEZI|nr:U3 small nucleolar RNA-associated 12 [Lecanosticta acicola]
MVRSYRKYEPAKTFGTVNTGTSNSVWTADQSSRNRNAGSGRAFVGANEEVLCWDVKKGELLSRWHDKDNRSAVTCISQCHVQPDLLAVGYTDGSIRIWDALSGQIVVSFNGHRSAVTLLQFDREGSRLASGSRDTDIIVWNLLSETAEFRLRGHKDRITGLSFLRAPVSAQADMYDGVAASEQDYEERYLLSTSKDALIKIWDLSTPHCIETHVAQTSGECWALGVSPDGAGCITAGNDGELKVWTVNTNVLSQLSNGLGEGKKVDVLTSSGIIHRQGKDRTTGIAFHPKQDYIAIHGSEKAVELWRIRSADDLHRHMQRKRRRRREKAAAAGETLGPEKEEALGTPEVNEIFVPYVIIRTGGKVRSANWVTSGSKSAKTLQLLAATTNNQLELYNVISHRAQEKTGSRDAPEYNRSLAVELPGHRTDIRTLSLSSDDRMLASASAGALKIWNLRTQSCLRTLECGTALCSSFLPGDRMVLVGTKSGELELYDISTSTLVEKIQAHDDAIWTLAVHPDGKSVVTGAKDKCAKFWRFDVVDEEIPGTRRTTQRLRLAQTRQLKVSDEVLSVCFSPDEKYLALSTLDNTVKLFFVDSLKPYHILYGHKLPVLDISISSDSKLIATCSADKNVRVWGMDFGDCHKAFFAHQDSVMQVAFISHPVEQDEKHMVISASKDGVLKTWDGDKFEQVQKLEGHHGEIWAMAVSRTGETIVTASHDKSIRTWEVGDDLVFLEEERERELEEMYEATLAQNMDRDFQGNEDQDGEVAAASKQTISTLTHGEKIMEALEVGITDLELMRAYERDKVHNPRMAVPQRNPIFLALGNITAEQHVLRTLQKVPTPALNDALLVIPFSTLPTLFTFLAIFLQKSMAPELAWRISYIMLQAHMTQIVASKQLKPLLMDVFEAYDQWQEKQSKIMGFNLAGLEIMSREARDNESGGYLDEPVEEEEEEGKGRKKRAFASVQ